MYVYMSVTLTYKKENQSLPCIKKEPASINISYKTYKTHLLRFNLAPFSLWLSSSQLCQRTLPRISIIGRADGPGHLVGGGMVNASSHLRPHPSSPHPPLYFKTSLRISGDVATYTRTIDVILRSMEPKWIPPTFRATS